MFCHLTAFWVFGEIDWSQNLWSGYGNTKLLSRAFWASCCQKAVKTMVRSRGSRCFLKTEKLLCLGFGKRLFFLWEHFPIDDLCATKNTEDDTRSRICSLFRSGLDDHLARWLSSPWGRAWHRPETSTTAIKEGWDNDPVVLKFWGGCGGSSKSNPFSQLPFQCGFPPGFPVSTLYTFVNNNKQRNKNQYQ